MLEIRKTTQFTKWLTGLKDIRAKAKILVRIDRAEEGNLGDVKFFDGIGEMRIDYGPGYRVYFQRQGDVLVLLLCGGDKSTQQTDIKRALEIAKGL